MLIFFKLFHIKSVYCINNKLNFKHFNMKKRIKWVLCLILLLLLFVPQNIHSQVDTTGHLQILTGYYNDLYSQPYSRNFNVFYGGFGYKSPNTSIFGKVNYGMTSKILDGEYLEPKSYGLQYELDYYQRLTKSTTSWWNYAYSNSTIFPDHRFMMRVWQKLPAAFLVSGGMSYYNFYGNHTHFLNFGLEKYVGKYWFEYKIFVPLYQPNVATSHFLSARRFFKDINYLQLTVGYGPSDDDPWDADNYKLLNAYRAGILYVTNVGDRFRIRAGVNYMYENYNENDWRNRYSLAVGLTFNIN